MSKARWNWLGESPRAMMGSRRWAAWNSGDDLAVAYPVTGPGSSSGVAPGHDEIRAWCYETAAWQVLTPLAGS